jgi:hypothetical protein
VPRTAACVQIVHHDQAELLETLPCCPGGLVDWVQVVAAVVAGILDSAVIRSSPRLLHLVVAAVVKAGMTAEMHHVGMIAAAVTVTVDHIDCSDIDRDYPDSARWPKDYSDS